MHIFIYILYIVYVNVTKYINKVMERVYSVDSVHIPWCHVPLCIIY